MVGGRWFMIMFWVVNNILKGEEVYDSFGGGWKTRFPQAWHLTHESIDFNQQDQFNSSGLYDIHIMSNKLNRLRRLTLNNRRFERSKQTPNVRAGILCHNLTLIPRFAWYTPNRVRLGMNRSYSALCCNTVINILPTSHYTMYLYIVLWQMWCMIFFPR